MSCQASRNTEDLKGWGGQGMTCPYRMELLLHFSLKKGEQKITEHYLRDECFFFLLIDQFLGKKKKF